MKEYFRWQLKIGTANYYTANPVPSDAHGLLTELQSGEKFRRTKFDNTLIFHTTDFDAINAAAFDTEFRVLLQQQQHNNSFQSVSPVYKFFKTDCVFRPNERQVTVTLQPFDVYDTILAGMEKEFNIVTLAPPTVSVNFVIQPIFQVVAIQPSGTLVLNNFLGGTFFETPLTSSPSPGDLESLYHFGFVGKYGVMVGVGEGLTPDIAGEYVDLDNNPTDPKWIRKDGVYRLEVDFLGGSDFKNIVKRVSDNFTVYEGTLNDGFEDAVFTSTSSSDTTVFRNFSIYARLLTLADVVDGSPTFDIPADDIVSDHGNYTKVIGIGNSDPQTYGTPWASVVYARDDHSTDSERWGKFSVDAFLFGNEYFVSPTGDNEDSIYPLSRSEWTGASCWWEYDSVLRAFQESAAFPSTVKHAYKLSDVIKVLLEAIGSTATHDDGAAWSDFLYAASNDIRGSRMVPVICPKTNVLVSEYTEPDKKEPIRLREVIELIKVLYNGGWYINGESKFCIEVEPFFRNGRSYAGPQVGADLTQYVDSRHGLPWALAKTEYRYEKQNLPERVEFGWMDKVSLPFNGYPIEMISGFVEKGKVDKLSIGRFTSDIDFFNVAASDIVKDGFVFFECIEDGDDLNVPFLDFSVSATEEYKLQNGYASFLYSHDKYWRHNLPCPSVRLNTNLITADSVMRSKTQELTVPLITSFSAEELVTSSLGTGEVVSVKKNLTSGRSDIVIKLDN